MDSKFTVSEARAPNGVSEWITALLCEGGSRKSEEVGEEGVLMGPTHTKKKKKGRNMEREHFPKDSEHIPKNNIAQKEKK